MTTKTFALQGFHPLAISPPVLPIGEIRATQRQITAGYREPAWLFSGHWARRVA